MGPDHEGMSFGESVTPVESATQKGIQIVPIGTLFPQGGGFGGGFPRFVKFPPSCRDEGCVVAHHLASLGDFRSQVVGRVASPVIGCGQLVALAVITETVYGQRILNLTGTLLPPMRREGHHQGPNPQHQCRAQLKPFRSCPSNTHNAVIARSASQPTCSMPTKTSPSACSLGNKATDVVTRRENRLHDQGQRRPESRMGPILRSRRPPPSERWPKHETHPLGESTPGNPAQI